MAKSLIITEKPSVAQDIARALGGFKKNKEYFESDQYLLSWAVGHLFELAVPEKMKNQDKWSLDKLPIMPVEFDLNPQEKAGSRVRTLVKLLRDKNVSEVINACDAGREGELIFRYIIQYAQSDKPIKRLWLSSMTLDAIRQGFEQLRSDSEMRPLAEAARSRNEADWLVGINATRAFTLRLSGGKGSTVTSLGRVQTPTLAIIVEREEKIKKFRPRDLFEVFGNFRAAAGNYIGRWFDESFEKDESEMARTSRLLKRFTLTAAGMKERLSDVRGSLWDEHRAPSRLWLHELAQAIEKKCAGKQGVVELEETKPTTQIAPQLYDLTTLQREANNRFGYPAKRTLQLAQSLYEKHKVITYPRTDSRCLPEDYSGMVKDVLKQVSETSLAPFAQKVLSENWVRPNKRIFNNTKVSDHFAIIPTTVTPAGLRDDEATIYQMIAKRFIAAFYPPAQFEVTTRITRVEGEPFKTEGKILRVLGWMEVYGREARENGDQNLPPVTQGERVATESIEIKQDQTKPPPRYTEATILSAMENAGKLVDDEELAEAMKERGLGTPATRAQIIETLIHAHYLHRHGKELQPTSKAIQTISLLRSIPVSELVSPELTGDWEFRLREIEHRKLTRETFMRDIRKLTTAIVEKAKSFTPDEHVANSEPFGKCPKCGHPLHERFKNYQCTNTACDFTLWKTIAGRLLTREEFETLLCERKIGPLTGFRSKAGKRFNAVLKMNDDFKVEFDFEATAAAAATEIKCDKCGKPMAIKTGRRGEFLACTGYPECKNATGFRRNENGDITVVPRAALPPELENIKEVCNKCGQPMVVKLGRFGFFLACSGYPDCKTIKKISISIAKPTTKKSADKQSLAIAPTEKVVSTPTGEKCEKCGSPMVQRMGRFGPFAACSAYPKCKNIRKSNAAQKATKETTEERNPPRKRRNSADSPVAETANPAAASELKPARTEAEPTHQVCDKCGAPMVIRSGRYGKFVACSAYPECRNTKKLPV